MKSLGFSIKAVTGYVVVIVLFAAGLAFIVYRLDAIGRVAAGRIRPRADARRRTTCIGAVGGGGA